MPSSPSRGSALLFFLAMVASLFTVVLSTDSKWTWFDCQSSSVAAASSTNSTFWSNVVALLDELPSAAVPTGVASLSRGNGTDRAFVRGICRGDSTAAQCATYVQNAALGIRSRCNTTRRAAIWYDDGSAVANPAPMFCFVSYADTNASTAYEDAYRQEFQNGAVVSNTVTFETTYNTLMSRLARQVVDGSATSSTAPMFATGAAVYDSTAPNGTMYGLLQCMRDRTAAECRKCLNDSVQRLPSCCSGHRGGLVLGYNCYLRMEVYPYYDLALDGTPLLAPAPAPSTFVGESRPDNSSSKEEDIGYFESEQLNLVVIRAATNNFSEENKLGEGGFGEVFKGTLQDGEEIAVKRLSKNSSQGFHELKNELVLAAKLKHRNLVQLLGVCLQEEKMLIYEYMPNRSLDTFLLDPVRRQQLDWSKRFAIICGIARGLLYLHDESRLKVIHRDLKPSNVLLDADMNPKISDFGIARAFHGDQSRDITRRPVGTLGYMAPEYAYWGHVSSKSDMFSFGVIILEMVTGRRNNSAYDSEIDSVSVLSHVWDKWRTGSTADVVDPLLAESGYPEGEVLNCIEVGLLCVQENPADRPDASAVVLMLSSPTSTSDDRRAPSRPAFAFSSGITAAASYDGPRAASWSSDSVLISNQQQLVAAVSENEMSISELQPR
ncbi:cysteine-rich receptor-like protein kinase 15 isoform X2 [Miscanthus floridulus]|uniref:cysteine-rich receptor-like protein kinase 15 isoform X2 n=1 Tax=Miscanthus floridulus TaxID=154761 RepID=UPI0034575939